MKKFVKTLAIVGAVSPAVVTLASAQAANTVNCGSSFLPAGLCNAFAGASGFTVSGILSIVFAAVIAFLVLYILFQIVKAVFDWIGKSNDDKARAAAIKSITNAVVAGIVLIIALLVVVFGSKALGIGDVPNPLYGCYASGGYAPSNVQGQKAQGTATATSIALSGVSVYEGSPSAKNNSKNTPGYGGTTDDSQTTLSSKLYCKDDRTGEETTNSYFIAKKVGVEKTN